MTVTTTPLDATERVHLARAVALATRARGTTSPNPAVGCVLLRGDEVVGQGVTAPPGGPHAEVVALREAGTAARGATAVVTLEPCDHHGRTPPCTDALVSAGVRRVVVGHPDPNPIATGGADTLRAAGIEVSFAPPTFRAWVAGELEGFLTAVTAGRPHVTLKLAQTVDGQLAPPAGSPWITGSHARRAVHAWRAAVDAVLVGSGTVLADDPSLDVRDAPLGRRAQPRPVVLDTRLRTPPTARVVARGAIIVTSDESVSTVAAAALAAAGAEIVAVPRDGRSLSLAPALAVLAARGITSLLAEPGETLARALLAAGLVDRFVRHVALDLGAGPPRRACRGDEAGWTTTRLGGVGTDLVWERTPTAAAPRHQEPR